MSERRRKTLYGLGAAAAVVLLLAGFLAWRSGRATAVGNYTVHGFDLSGLSPEQTLEALREMEAALASSPIAVEAGGVRFQLLPSSAGFDLDEQAALDAALEGSAPGSFFDSVRGWLGLGGGQTQVLPISGAVDEEALARILDGYEQALGAPVEGGVTLEGTLPVPRYPRAGQSIDRAAAVPRIAAALFEQPRPELVVIDVSVEQPLLPGAAVDEAYNEILRLLNGPITLTRNDPDVTLVLSEEQLARALVTRIEAEPSPRLAVSFDPALFDEYLRPAREGFASPPEDARILIDDDDRITIVPGFPGAVIDTNLVIQAAVNAAGRPNRTTVLPLEGGVQPKVTAEYLTGLAGIEKISEFTTRHPCCQPRVGNIQLFADSMNGRVVLPGEYMSLNETVGERTLEAGYAPAPTIIRGEIVDTVGGGVSQFATTFFNAVYWAGLEIIEHKPHSFYFSRYPEGVEATISWPEPDLVFRNDTQTAVVVKTAYTGDSITVKLFGNNSDRLVSSSVSGRFAPTDFPTVYFPNPELSPWDEEVETQGGANGWSVVVTRTLTFTDGAAASQDWTVRYRAWPRHAEVHPCLLPEDSEFYTGEECPEEPPPPAEEEGGLPEQTPEEGEGEEGAAGGEEAGGEGEAEEQTEETAEAESEEAEAAENGEGG